VARNAYKGNQRKALRELSRQLNAMLREQKAWVKS
jgi:hypothetical protein